MSYVTFVPQAAGGEAADPGVFVQGNHVPAPLVEQSGVWIKTAGSAILLQDSYRLSTLDSPMWLVVDDGSADNTWELFERWQKEDNPFPIRYFKQENGGKCRAINRGLELAQGELFFTVDSDDYLTDDALEIAEYTNQNVFIQNLYPQADITRENFLYIPPGTSKLTLIVAVLFFATRLDMAVTLISFSWSTLATSTRTPILSVT